MWRTYLVLKIVECAALLELDALRTEWDDLLARSEHASIYATWEWAEANWRFAAPDKQPLLLLAREAEGRLIGILPLARTLRAKVVRTLEVLGCTRTGYPLGDYGGLVAERGAEDSVLSAMLKHLQSTGGWIMLDLRNCRSNSPLRTAQLGKLYSEASSNHGWDAKISDGEECRVLPLPGTFQEYLAGLSSNSRQNFRRKLRKVAQAGISIDAVNVQDGGALRAAMEQFFEFHQERWTERGAEGGFPVGRVREMHLHLAANLAARGWLDLRVARSPEGRTLGAIYNFKYNGTVYYYHIGFNNDEEWSTYSLGFCLLANSIEAAIGSGCHTFDLLRGDHEYKRHFGGYTTRNVRISIYRYNWLPLVEDAAWRLRRMLRNRRFQPVSTGPTIRVGATEEIRP